MVLLRALTGRLWISDSMIWVVDVQQQAHQVLDVERFPDKVFNCHSSKGRGDIFQAVGARKNRYQIRSQTLGRFKYVAA